MTYVLSGLALTGQQRRRFKACAVAYPCVYDPARRNGNIDVGGGGGGGGGRQVSSIRARGAFARLTPSIHSSTATGLIYSSFNIGRPLADRSRAAFSFHLILQKVCNRLQNFVRKRLIRYGACQ
jgi:hypothetical protein